MISKRTGPEPAWEPTHCLVAQKVRLLDRDKSGRVLVEFEDGSQGWHDGPLIPVELVYGPDLDVLVDKLLGPPK